MARLSILLSESETEALAGLARRERRRLSEQAAYLIVQKLRSTRDAAEEAGGHAPPCPERGEAGDG